MKIHIKKLKNDCCSTLSQLPYFFCRVCVPICLRLRRRKRSRIVSTRTTSPKAGTSSRPSGMWGGATLSGGSTCLRTCRTNKIPWLFFHNVHKSIVKTYLENKQCSFISYYALFCYYLLKFKCCCYICVCVICKLCGFPWRFQLQHFLKHDEIGVIFLEKFLPFIFFLT